MAKAGLRVFVVAGSPVAHRPWSIAPGPDDRVIAADLGAAHARSWGWPVHLLIGDLDSLPADVAREVKAAGAAIERAPVAKDETDTELALARALALDPAQIVIGGAIGGRIDHFLANVLLLTRPDLARRDVSLVDGGETVRLLTAEREPSTLVIDGAPGDLVSLLPVGGDALEVSTQGLQYPLRGETLYMGGARGVSNVLTGPRGEVTLRRGRLFVCHVTVARTRMEEK